MLGLISLCMYFFDVKKQWTTAVFQPAWQEIHCVTQCSMQKKKTTEGDYLNSK